MLYVFFYLFKFFDFISAVTGETRQQSNTSKNSHNTHAKTYGAIGLICNMQQEAAISNNMPTMQNKTQVGYQ